MAQSPLHLFTLIDAYAAARAERESARECASWAFLAAHRAMVEAREAVALALDIGVSTVPVLTDDTTALASDGFARAAAWQERIDAALSETLR